MKKLFALITIIIIVGFSVTGCGTNDEKQTSSSNVETNYNTEEVAGEIEDQEKKEETTNKEEQNDTEIKEDTEAVEHSGDAEKVLFSFFEAMTDQDVEKAREYVLYDDLDYPFLALEEGLDYYSENKPIDIIKVEELSEDMKMIYVNIDTPEKKIEDSYLLKKVDNAWRVATQGVISRYQSVHTDDQVKDGEIGIYLKNIYHDYNGVDTYAVNIVNNTDEKFNIGFVNRGAVIYENDAGKGYIELQENFVVNPYNKNILFFTVDSSEGPVKSIVLKEVMLGLQAQTSEVEVFMGEMIEQ